MPCAGCAKRKEWIRQKAEVVKSHIKTMIKTGVPTFGRRPPGPDEMIDGFGNVVKRPPS